MKFDLLVFNIVLGVIRCTCRKMAWNSITAGRRANGSAIWDSGVVVTCICGTFGLLVFKVSLRSFDALVSRLPVTRKRLAVERKIVKFGLRA